MSDIYHMNKNVHQEAAGDSAHAKTHGGNRQELARQLGANVSDVLDFSASINPLGMPYGVESTIADAIAEVLHYPEPYAETLRDALAYLHDIDPERIVVGNGSTELLYLLPRVLRPKKALIHEPCFSEYRHALELSGAEVLAHQSHEQDAFMPDVEAFGRRLAEVDLALLCNPGNPSGRALTREEVLALIDAAHKADTFLIVDEAFMDFCPEHSVVDAGVEHEGLVVVRSMTKFYGLAGLRVGYAVMPQALSALVMRQKEPWSVNALASAAARAALLDREFPVVSRALINEQRVFMSAELSALGFEVFPSDVNYLLLRHAYASLIVQQLLVHDLIAVRDCSNFRGLEPGRYLRVAVRSRVENLRLLEALSSLLKEVPPAWHS